MRNGADTGNPEDEIRDEAEGYCCGLVDVILTVLPSTARSPSLSASEELPYRGRLLREDEEELGDPAVDKASWGWRSLS